MQGALNDICFSCAKCEERKPLRYFTPTVCKQHLQGERRSAKKCFERAFPECAIDGCKQRPACAVGHNHVEADGKWFCHSHRYPPCSVCRRTPRPASAISGKIKFKAWCAMPAEPAEAPSPRGLWRARARALRGKEAMRAARRRPRLIGTVQQQQEATRLPTPKLQRLRSWKPVAQERSHMERRVKVR